MRGDRRAESISLAGARSAAPSDDVPAAGEDMLAVSLSRWHGRAKRRARESWHGILWEAHPAMAGVSGFHDRLSHSRVVLLCACLVVYCYVFLLVASLASDVIVAFLVVALRAMARSTSGKASAQSYHPIEGRRSIACYRASCWARSEHSKVEPMLVAAMLGQLCVSAGGPITIVGRGHLSGEVNLLDGRASHGDWCTHASPLGSQPRALGVSCRIGCATGVCAGMRSWSVRSVGSLGPPSFFPRGSRSEL